MDIIFRLLRGLIGAAVIYLGYMNESWIGLMGVFLIISAVSGRCGLGAADCSINHDSKPWYRYKGTRAGRIKE